MKLRPKTCLVREWNGSQSKSRSPSPVKLTDGVAETFEIVPEPGRRPSTRPSSGRRQPNQRESRFSLLGQNSCDT